MRSNKWMLLAAGLMLLPATVHAQQRPLAARRAEAINARAQAVDARAQAVDARAEAANARATTARPATSPAMSVDRTIANCLAISNQEEIALARLATTLAENPKVQKLAEAMIKDHEQYLADLKHFSGDVAAIRIRSEDETVLTGDVETSPQPARRPVTLFGVTKETGGLDFLQLKREMAEKCVQSADAMWKKERGAQADECFVGAQIVMHHQLADAQKVLRNHASPELQAVIDKGIKTAKEHATHAEALMKELESARSQSKN